MGYKSNLLERFLGSLPKEVRRPVTFLVSRDREFGCYWDDSKFYIEVSFFDDGEYNYLIWNKETNFAKADYRIADENEFEIPIELKDFILKCLYWGIDDELR